MRVRIAPEAIAPVIVAVFMVTALCGCMEKNTDPHKGGFIGGLQGIYTGDYDKRIKEREGALAREKETTQQLKVEFEQRELDYKARASELSSEQQRMELMNQNIQALSRDIARINARDASQRMKLTNLKARIRKVQNEIEAFNKSGRYAVGSEQYQMLEKKRNSLAQEYKALLEYTSALSNSSK